jgi:peptide-methionine (S)-S-oxide reductase
MRAFFLALFLTVGGSAMAQNTTATALVGGGCFWCVQSDFQKLAGVVSATSGYSGGSRANPTYETYHLPGDEPHVEVVQVTYDPTQLSYDDVLTYFLRHIDPTDGGGQFCDRGPAYRPVIFTASDTEAEAARRALEAAGKALGQPLKVDVLPAKPFWPAEDYHQDYHRKNPTRYAFYRWNCGRDQRVKELWGGQ